MRDNIPSKRVGHCKGIKILGIKILRKVFYCEYVRPYILSFALHSYPATHTLHCGQSIFTSQKKDCQATASFVLKPCLFTTTCTRRLFKTLRHPVTWHHTSKSYKTLRRSLSYLYVTQTSQIYNPYPYKYKTTVLTHAYKSPPHATEGKQAIILCLNLTYITDTITEARRPLQDPSRAEETGEQDEIARVQTDVPACKAVLKGIGCAYVHVEGGLRGGKPGRAGWLANYNT